MFRRCKASPGCSTGSYAEGACTRPTRSAACARSSSSAETEKYVLAAAWIPYAPWPKYTVFRYRARISSLLSSRSTCQASRASLTFRSRVRSESRYRFFTYCSVIVEAPWTIRPLVAFT